MVIHVHVHDLDQIIIDSHMNFHQASFMKGYTIQLHNLWPSQDRIGNEIVNRNKSMSD